MLDKSILKKISRARLKDAEALQRSRRYDGAIYLCGYAIELALKSRICKILHWTGYPETRSEFQNFQTFRTHNLDVLLSLSGLEEKIKNNYFVEWNIVAEWDPEVRYKPVGNAKSNDSKLMISAAKVLLRIL
ncbi:MAG: hypothetical protein ACE5K4_11305 [Candidatus Hydrothermarchaeota archaeon]